jgi:hypothetical protein
MSVRLYRRYLLSIGLAGALALAFMAAPAGADKPQSVKCVGTGDFCGATVSIAGGASNRVVTVRLTDTDFSRVAVRVIPGTSKGAFSISKASFRLGGSAYRFTLSAVRSNPRGARIVLLFAAGKAA